MNFQFTELDHDNEALQFGGSLTITAQSSPQVEHLIKHFKLFPDLSCVDTLKARVEALERGTLTHTIHSTKRPMFKVSSCLDYEFTLVYKQWAEQNFGYEGVFPDLEIPRDWYGLKYTNYQERLYTQGEHICFDTHVSTGVPSKGSAQDYAESYAKDTIGEEFGMRHFEPEFIRGGNNHYKKNPDYLKRYNSSPSASNEGLKVAFFNWWLENHANEAQKAIVEGNKEVSEGMDYMNAFRFKGHESTIYYTETEDGYKSITFQEFSKLT